MSEEMKNLPTEETEEVAVEAKTKSKSDNKKANKKPNIFVRVCKKIAKLFTDVVGEMKKVVWTPVAELKKSTLIVVVTVLCVAIAIAIIDAAFSWAINGIAGLFPII